MYLLNIVKKYLFFSPSLSFLCSCGTKINRFTGLLFSQPPHNPRQFSNCCQAFCEPHTWDNCRKVWEETKISCVHQHTGVAQSIAWAVSLRTGVPGSRNPKRAEIQLVLWQQERESRHRMTCQCSAWGEERRPLHWCQSQDRGCHFLVNQIGLWRRSPAPLKKLHCSRIISDMFYWFGWFGVGL